MNSVLKMLLFGALVWLIPFAISFAFFPGGQPLFDVQTINSIMIIVWYVVLAVFMVLYFSKEREDSLRKGIVVGVVWLAESIILDAFTLPLSTSIDWGAFIVYSIIKFVAILIMCIAMGAIAGK